MAAPGPGAGVSGAVRFRFVFGVARSGTTLLGRLMAATSTPTRFVHELCPGIPDRIPSPRFMVEPGDAETIARVREALFLLAAGGSPFDPSRPMQRIERDDPGAEVLIVKDVHSLLAWREILAGIGDWRAVVVTRDPLRTLDSYFHGHRPAQRRYLVDEYDLVAARLREGGDGDDPLLRAVARLHAPAARHFRRPRILTSELFRQAAITDLVAGSLRAWAAEDERISHVTFEDLCRDPIAQSKRLFAFLGLKYDDRTLAEVRRTTTGRSDAYYATDKDSARILEQPWRHLGALDRFRLARFLGRPWRPSLRP